MSAVSMVSWLMSSTLRLSSPTTLDCSSVAVATWMFMSLIWVMCPVIWSRAPLASSAWVTTRRLWLRPWAMALTARALCSWRLLIMPWISAVEAAERLARLRTSSATTAKPRPCSPARAASMAALRASRLVCSEMLRMVSRMLPMESVWLARDSMTPATCSISPERPTMP